MRHDWQLARRHPRYSVVIINYYSPARRVRHSILRVIRRRVFQAAAYSALAVSDLTLLGMPKKRTHNRLL